MGSKLEDAKMTLFLAEDYMNELAKESFVLESKKVSDAEVEEYIRMLLPIATNATEITEKNIQRYEQI